MIKYQPSNSLPTGHTFKVDGHDVIVTRNGGVDIDYQRYTADYSEPATLCYRVVKTNRRYKTMSAAVKAHLAAK